MYATDVLVPLQGSINDAIDQAVSGTIEYLPTIVAALLILLVGYIIGRFLGGLVTRILRRIGIDRYASDTAVTEVSQPDTIARAVGKIVAYYVYFVAVLAAASVLDIPELSSLLRDIGVFLPVILAAIAVLVIGFVVGRIVGDMVADVVSGFGIGPYLRETPLESLGDQKGEFGRIVGLLVTYYIYLITLLAVADIVNVTALSTLLNDFAGYLPALVGGLVVLLVGIWVAERVARLVRESGEGAVMGVAALFVKVLIYYITVTIALGTIGFDTTVLTTMFTGFVAAFFGMLALALAIGIGIAVGFGGQDFVAENIDGWAGSVREMATVESEGGEESSEEGGAPTE
ncbi:MAG: mechanosensitive ion channel [Halapricum sp.]